MAHHRGSTAYEPPTFGKLEAICAYLSSMAKLDKLNSGVEYLVLVGVITSVNNMCKDILVVVVVIEQEESDKIRNKMNILFKINFLSIAQRFAVEPPGRLCTHNSVYNKRHRRRYAPYHLAEGQVGSNRWLGAFFPLYLLQHSDICGLTKPFMKAIFNYFIASLFIIIY